MDYAQRLAHDHVGGRRRGLCQMPLAAALAVLVAAQSSVSGQGVDAAVEQALLKEDWPAIVRLPQLATDATLASESRFIKAHAYLALNRNNESVCLFLGATDPELTQWAAWTSRLVEQRPSAAIAHYVRGDALARAAELDAALAAFDTGLKARPKHALILNARGVLQASRGKIAEARVDFAEATEQRDLRLADAHANSGALFIQRKEGAEAAAQAFARALAISPTSALALHGRGSVEIVLNNTREAEANLRTAVDQAGCAGGLLARNALSIAAYWEGQTSEQLLAPDNEEPGTTLNAMVGRTERAWTNYIQNPTSQTAYNQFHKQFAQLPQQAQAQFYQQNMARDLKSYPVLPQQFAQRLARVDSFNNNGWAAMNVRTARMATAALASLVPANTLPSVALKSALLVAPLHFDRMDAATRSHGAAATNLQTWHRRNLPTPARLPAGLPGTGGVDTSFAAAQWDNGEWPFEPIYGLLYPLAAR